MIDHTLDFWWAHLSDFADRIDELQGTLPADEQQRAARFRVAIARDRFVLARTLLRRVLGEILETEPATLAFAAGKHGKPHLLPANHALPPYFNLSHSGEVVALAIAPVEIGVDVEVIRAVRNAHGLAQRFFGPAESAMVCGLTGSDRDHAFLRIWTQKEAYLKATGLGVGMPLREIETQFDPAKPPGLRAIAGDRDEARGWALNEVQVPNAVCTTAIRGTMPKLDIRRFSRRHLT